MPPRGASAPAVTCTVLASAATASGSGLGTGALAVPVALHQWNRIFHTVELNSTFFPYCGILITQYGIRVGLITQYGMSRIPYCAIESIEFHSMESIAQYGIQAFHTVQLNP